MSWKTEQNVFYLSLFLIHTWGFQMKTRIQDSGGPQVWWDVVCYQPAVHWQIWFVILCKACDSPQIYKHFGGFTTTLTLKDSAPGSEDINVCVRVLRVYRNLFHSTIKLLFQRGPAKKFSRFAESWSAQNIQSQLFDDDKPSLYCCVSKIFQANILALKDLVIQHQGMYSVVDSQSSRLL